MISAGTLGPPQAALDPGMGSRHSVIVYQSAIEGWRHYSVVEHTLRIIVQGSGFNPQQCQKKL